MLVLWSTSGITRNEIYVTPMSFSPIRIKKITLIIETNRPSHSDTKKLFHFTEVTHYLLLSQLSIFQQKAERETIALLNDLKDLTLSPLFLFVKTI